MFHEVTRDYKRLHRATRGEKRFQGLEEVTGSYKKLQEVTEVT